ncbi:FdtA/QdtA family cupin domain-containing protein [Hymenobacter sp. BT175]|uniref:sugar 3,4-ketoisomerase n=1 Tax=Hymenobacter translucens TaxID=2886507 RepID=UPI001D0E6071|nr:FdtA/QdtA family cupin domain-containing protein [Hymenobacter translucens]MCC2547929.1 FdtA/QdtA family cupin domain-containing protein [Hymenobacter translucens]
MQKPYLIDFPRIGASDIGYISVSESARAVPFEIERVFWTYYTPESIVRGRHAHHATAQVLVAVSGRILVTTEMPDGEIMVFVLESPSQGVYIPPHVWHTMQYSHTAVQLAFASTLYDEADYIRQYDDFRQQWPPLNS